MRQLLHKRVWIPVPHPLSLLPPPHPMRSLVSVLTLLGLITSAIAYQAPGPPDYAAITAAADVAFEGTVQSVHLAKKDSQLTKVVLRITKVTKGDLKKGDLIAIYHEPGRLDSKRGSGIRSFRCPPFAEFTELLSYSVWASWDAKKKHYFVPGAAWTRNGLSEKS